MLHLRVIAPQERAEDVIALLKGEVGVAHLVVHRGVALEPQGDEITADIARECANELVESLKELGLHHSGAITLDVVDTVLSTAAHRAEKTPKATPPTPSSGKNSPLAPATNLGSTSPSSRSFALHA